MREIPDTFRSRFRWWELLVKRVDIALFAAVAQLTHLAPFQDERAVVKNTASRLIGCVLAVVCKREKQAG